jgi:hypothetical protein
VTPSVDHASGWKFPLLKKNGFIEALKESEHEFLDRYVERLTSCTNCWVLGATAVIDYEEVIR